MDFDIENAGSARNPVRRLGFIVMLLACSLACFVSVIADIVDRNKLANGVPATIKNVGSFQGLPNSYSFYEGEQRAVFDVKIENKDGGVQVLPLFLPKPVIEKLIAGESEEIVYVKDNPRRHLIAGRALPAVGWGWAVGGVVFLLVGLFAARIRHK